MHMRTHSAPERHMRHCPRRPRWLIAILLIAGAIVCRADGDRGSKPERAASVPGKNPEFCSPKDLRSPIDQGGRPFSFARLAKKTVPVNFISGCQMIRPTQAQELIGIQRANRNLPSAKPSIFK